MKNMSEIEFTATTTDCWTEHRRSFIGVMATLIAPETLQRCHAALACKQLKGAHSFIALTGAVNKIHTVQREKIVRTTTDKGSNFLKAFRVYECMMETIIQKLWKGPGQVRWEKERVMMMMKKRGETVRVLSLLKLEPCWTKMMAWNINCLNTIAVPTTFSTWCLQLMSWKPIPI